MDSSESSDSRGGGRGEPSRAVIREATLWPGWPNLLGGADFRLSLPNWRKSRKEFGGVLWVVSLDACASEWRPKDVQGQAHVRPTPPSCVPVFQIRCCTRGSILLGLIDIIACLDALCIAVPCLGGPVSCVTSARPGRLASERASLS